MLKTQTWMKENNVVFYWISCTVGTWKLRVYLQYKQTWICDEESQLFWTGIHAKIPRSVYVQIFLSHKFKLCTKTLRGTFAYVPVQGFRVLIDTDRFLRIWQFCRIFLITASHKNFALLLKKTKNNSILIKLLFHCHSINKSEYTLYEYTKMIALIRP